MNGKKIRWLASLVILALVLLTWRITVTSWEGEIGGLYSFPRAIFNLVVSLSGLALIYFLLSDMPSRHKALTVITAMLTAAFCLFILEIPALFFGFNYQLVFGTSMPDTALHLSDKANKPDPVLIHIHWPNSSFTGEVSGNLVQLGIPTDKRYQVDVHYDHNGFRNDQEYLQADVAVIGDSFVEAAIIPRQQSLEQLLENHLGHSTINLGQIAYGLRQELEVLKRYALPLKPKLVLWVLFGGNDLRDIKLYEKQLEQVGELHESVPIEQLFIYNSLIAAGNLYRRIFNAVPRALHHSGLFTRTDGIIERVYFGQSTDNWTPHQWQVTIDTLKEANRLTSENGAVFVVVYVPRKFRIYKEHIKLSPEHNIASWKINSLPNELEKWCAEQDMFFIDTSPHLEEYVAKGVHPYLIDDVHWNSLGHETAAVVIKQYLSSRGIFPFQEQ